MAECRFCQTSQSPDDATMEEAERGEALALPAGAELRVALTHALTSAEAGRTTSSAAPPALRMVGTG